VIYPTGTSLIERDEELALLRRLITHVRVGQSSVVEIVGPPGCGRSAVLDAAKVEAGRNGLRVVSARGTPEFADLDGGVLAQFLAALGAVAVSPLLDPGTGRPKASAIRFCGAFLAAARRRPLLLALDDAEWADEYSAGWLWAMVRRVREAQVLIAIAAGPRGSSFGPTLAQARSTAVAAGTAWHVLRPRPLTLTGVREFLDVACPDPPAPRFAEAVMLHTEGNPALVRSVADSVRSPDAVETRTDKTGTDKTAAAAGQPAAADGDQPALAAMVADHIGDRADALIRTLPPDALALLRAISACAPGFGWELVTTLAGLRGDSAGPSVQLLRELGLITTEDPPGLGHPALAGRVLAEMCRPEREKLLADAADLGHRAAVATDGLAGVLLSAPVVGRPWAARVLRHAAEHSKAEGRPEMAARYLNRALREPLQAEDRAALVLALASVEMRYAPERSDRRLIRLLLGTGAWGPYRALAADLSLARGNATDVKAAIGSALADLDLAPADRANLGALRSLAADGGGTDLPLAPVPLPPDEPANAAWSAAKALRLAVAGHDLARTRALARAALSHYGGPRAPLCPRIMASRVLLVTDNAAEAIAGLDAVLVDAGRRGAPSATATARLARSTAHLRLGLIEEASTDLNLALTELPLECWHPSARPQVLAAQIALHLEEGQLDRAARLAEIPLPPGIESGSGWSQLLLAKGMFRLRTGDAAAAADYFHEVGRRMLARRWLNPALPGWRSLAALAHQACGNSAEAERLITDELAAARCWGAPNAVGEAHLVAAKISTGTARMTSLEAAVEALRYSSSRLRYAAALIQLAEARRDQGDTIAVLRLSYEAGEIAWAGGVRELIDQARDLGWRPGQPDHRPLAEAEPSMPPDATERSAGSRAPST
jgi:hypothetical protein